MTTPTGSNTTSTPRAVVRMLVAALVLAGLGPVRAFAQSDQVAPMSAAQRLRYEVAAQGLVISIRTARNAPVKVDQEGRDLLILFSDTVPLFDAEALQRSTDPWIDHPGCASSDPTIFAVSLISPGLRTQRPTLLAAK